MARDCPRDLTRHRPRPAREGPASRAQRLRTQPIYKSLDAPGKFQVPDRCVGLQAPSGVSSSNRIWSGL